MMIVQRNVLVLLLAVCLFFGGCAGLPTGRNEMVTQESTATIYLVSHGWHTTIVIRRTDIPRGVWKQHRDMPPAGYLEVGWGDADFYQAHAPGIGVTVKAALWPTQGVLHVVGFQEPVASYFPYNGIVALAVDDRGMRALCVYMEKGYALDEDGQPVVLGKGLYGESRFYESAISYHLCRTCNVWASRALEEAGYPMGLFPPLTAAELMKRAAEVGEVIRLRSE